MLCLTHQSRASSAYRALYDMSQLELPICLIEQQPYIYVWLRNIRRRADKRNPAAPARYRTGRKLQAHNKSSSSTKVPNAVRKRERKVSDLALVGATSQMYRATVDFYEYDYLL